MRLHDALDSWAARQPDATFAEQAGRRLTYAEAAAASRRLAGSLCAAGVRDGDRVAVLSKNNIEFVLLYYAASRAGVATIPLNYRLAPAEWAFILADARPRLLFAASHFQAALDGLRGSLPFVERFVALGEARASDWESLDAWLAPGRALRAVEVGSDADVLQLYTSATTGQPKGAVLTHAAVMANVRQIGEAVGGPAGERSLVVAPLFHAAVVPSTFTTIARGGALVVQEDFAPAAVVRSLSEERIGFAVLVPAMILACLQQVAGVAERRYDALRAIYYGASPIAEPTLRRAIRAFGCGFVQSYGLTEATQSLTFLLPEDHERALADQPNHLLSSGRAAPETELRVVDAEDRDVPCGQAGEIVARGPQLMRGYWNRPDESADALRGGWLHTGDIGTLDADGYLYVRDRLKDMIVSGGENVYPSVVENVLYQHPAVADVAVIGVPDERWGEVARAVVVLRPEVPASGEEILGFCRQHLGGFEVPRAIDFVKQLPRNPSGKVLKRLLREPYWTAQARQVAGA